MIKTFRQIRSLTKNRHRELILSLFLSFLRSAFGVCQILAVIVGIECVTGQTEAKKAIISVAVLMVLSISGNFILSYFEQMSTMKTGFFMIADKRIATAGFLRKLPLGFFNKNTRGKITATLTTTLTGVESAAVMVTVGIISGLFNSFAFFLFMMFYDYRIGLLSFAGTLTYLLIVNRQMKLSEKNAPKLQKAQSKLAERALSFLGGIKVTKAFSFKKGDENLKEAINESCRENIALTSSSMPSQFEAGLCIALFESLILLCSLLFYFFGGNMSLVTIIVLLVFSFMVYASLNQAGSMLSMIGLLDAGLDEIAEIEKNKVMEVEEPEEHPISNEITFEDVSFSYGERRVLHHISTVMKDRSFNAIIGPSGSGKTTLCELIPRFREVDSGRILLGGADIRHIPEKELMAKISMVFQNVYLFEDTVLNNIRFGRPDATEEEVKAAARAASAEEFILNLKEGYNTVLEEGGAGLSGGEKQRIAIARAILKDAPIVILDEATSALDAENEHEILKGIEALIKNKTVIMIAHRLKTVEHAHHIIALKEGRIVEEGSNEELRTREGLYREFLSTRKEAENWKLNS